LKRINKNILNYIPKLKVYSLWSLFRPESQEVWRKREIRETFPRYYLLLNNKAIARFILAKSFPSDDNIDFSLPNDDLWKIHGRLQQKFVKYVAEFDQSEKKDVAPSPVNNNYLELKIRLSNKILSPCKLCARLCERERLNGEFGYCLVPEESEIASAFLHMGEESVLVPSGTIFFEGCTFSCVFCQNADIAQGWPGKGKLKNKSHHLSKDLARIQISLTKKGARNLNYVGGDPTPNLPSILESFRDFNENLCQLWNSNHYLSNESLDLIVDLFDFWLPDFKYWESEFAKKVSKVFNYKEILTRNLKRCVETGSGEMIVRHLCMPGRIEKDTIPILEWIAKELHPTGKVMVNIMEQYRPTNKVPFESRYEDINRRITTTEYQLAIDKAEELGLKWREVS
jgi:putative pyruvate formate lyase activating enzyme